MTNPFIKVLSLGEGRRLKKYHETVDKINALEAGLLDKSDADLRATADALRTRATAGEALDKLMPEAFALVREASKRTTGLRHYDVQLIGAMALHDGAIAEMKTGEGKTLVSTAACFLNALSGNNVHVVTVNDYLAKRDSEWMGKLYNFLGMEVGLVLNGMQPLERKVSYAASVTYGTNSEFGFDYLRDNMVSSAADRVQRGHHFAVVDEVDSILIDEARTPLIISGLGGDPSEFYGQFAAIAPRLKADEDFILDEAKRQIYATEEGLDRIEEMLGREVYTDLTGRLANHLKQALRAEFLFKKNVDYVVVDEEVKIVDEFTGRIMEGRRFSEGLHQALEAKEHVKVRAETQTLATITLQNYFRLYDKLSGMTGTAMTEDSEFRQIYNMPVVAVPTNKPVIRKDQDDYIFRTIEDKYKAVADEVERRHEKGQPVLVGTSSIEGSERIGRLLEKRGVPHHVLNAKNHEAEAKIIAQAGRVGAVTIATNMAGRGTDILLGGNKEQLVVEQLATHYGKTPEEAPDWMLDWAQKGAQNIVDTEGYAVRVLGGLCVIGTDRHESRRIDNQLRGRSGRQGDVGESRFYLSLEDNLLRRFGKDRLDAVAAMMEKQGLDESTPLQDSLVTKVINLAQHQVESMHFAARKNVLEYDDVMNLQRKAIYVERNAILDGKSVTERLPEIMEDVVYAAVNLYCPANMPSDDWEIKNLQAWITEISGLDAAFVAEIDHDDEPGVVADEILSRFSAAIDEKTQIMGADEMADVQKRVILRLIDNRWIDHLSDMEHLKSGIGLRAIGHRDPLVEYKEEAYDAFDVLVSSIYEGFVTTLLRMPVGTEEESEPVVVIEDNPFDPSNMVYSNSDEEYGSGDSQEPADPIMGSGK